MITSTINLSKQISKLTGLKAATSNRSRVKGLPNIEGDFRIVKGEIECYTDNTIEKITAVLHPLLVKQISPCSIFTILFTEYEFCD
jgi:hypothetical protein